jgi:hypothetical protein
MNAISLPPELDRLGPSPAPSALHRNDLGQAFRSNFLDWWHCSLEGLVFTQRLFRRLQDDDLAALYLAAWLFALDQADRKGIGTADLWSNASIMAGDTTWLTAVPVSEFADITGIPRETARRKLRDASKLLLVTPAGKDGFLLKSFSAEVQPLQEPCLGLARTLLASMAGNASEPPLRLEGGSEARLLRPYLDYILSLWVSRRQVTRISSAVSVQSAMELITTLKVIRRLSLKGICRQIDVATFLREVPAVRTTPYFISQVALICGLPVGQTRRMFRSLEAHGRVAFIDTDSVRPHPVAPSIEPSLWQTYFSEKSRQAGFRFLVATMACARETGNGNGHDA